MIAIWLATSMGNPAYASGEDIPTWTQRELIVYTNFVRVDPTHWSAEYDCSVNGFTSSEKQPKDPMLYHAGLTEIAQLHSEEMNRYDFLAHESRDGTDFGDRVWPYYEGTTIGENVAMGYSNNWDVVFQGWMCSAGHRSNIMEAEFEDIGTGIDGLYYTQDFGGGAGQAHQPVAMGIHSPQVPSNDVEFLATWHDDAAPESLWVETADSCTEMSLQAGTETRGAWTLMADATDGCQPYRFVWPEGDGFSSLPLEGAYQYGQNCADWTDEASETCIPEPVADSGDDCPEIDRNNDCLPDDIQSGPEMVGCITVQTGSIEWLGWLVLPALVRRRE